MKLMKEYDNFNYTCLFGGGAIRGAAHAGVVKCLEELGIHPHTIAGSSVGAMVAMLYAVGCTAEELSEAFLSVNFELFRDISFGFGFNQKFALSKGEVFLNWLRELIEKKYYGEKYVSGQNKPVKFSDLDKNLIIITTDLHTFKCKEFSKFETPDYEIAMAVRISCCMPGLMRAIHVGNELLVDGDLMKGKPMWHLSENLKNSSNRILEIRLEGTFEGSDDSPVEYVNGMYSCMTSTETDFIKNLYGNSDKYDYLVINTGNVVVVDFNYPKEKRQAIIDAGYRQAKIYFTDTLVEKKKKIAGIYTKILNSLRRIYFFMAQKKFMLAKNSTSELFIYLAEIKNYIDDDIYHSICLFQKILFANVKSGLLGRSTCKNAISVMSTLINITKDLEKRESLLKGYVSKYSN